ncbi:MAG: LptE family protein [Acidobacteria bacterium]|nr:LptE family protein [Acidobacteriota bacterium]
MNRTQLMLAPLTGIALLSACGYHTPGRSAALPAGIQTIAVPAFENRSHTYRLEQILTSAVLRELAARTRYRIEQINDPNADAMLRGVVLSTSEAPLTYDRQTGRASSMEVTVTVAVKLVARDGHSLYENPNYVFREQYEVSREITSFFEEESPALARLSGDFARTLVSNILEAY